MLEIRKGLEQGLDVAKYAKPELSCLEMNAAREKLMKRKKKIDPRK